jgi:hypothetical protein
MKSIVEELASCKLPQQARDNHREASFHSVEAGNNGSKSLDMRQRTVPPLDSTQ